MGFKSDTYRVFIASPSDMPEERAVTTDAVNEWSALYSADEGIVLLPVRWETHATPEAGIRGQDVINRDLVEPADILIGMFWTKLGTSTGAAKSGTVEEIDQFVKAGKPAMLYFSDRPISPNKINADQQKELMAFKDETYKNALCGRFSDLNDLKSTLLRDLTRTVRKLHAATKLSSASPVAATDESEQKRRAIAANEAFVEQVSEGKFHSLTGRRGIAAVSILPLNMLCDPLEFGRDFAQKYNALFSPMGTTGGHIRSVADGMVTLYYDQPEEERSLAKVTEWGEIFAANHWLSGDAEGDRYPTKPVDVPIYIHELAIISGIYKYFLLLNQLRIKGPWWVTISLLNMKGLRIIPSTQLPEKMLPKPITESKLYGSCRVDEGADLSSPAAVAAAIRKALDRLWRGFNMETNVDPWFGDDNTYTRRFLQW